MFDLILTGPRLTNPASSSGESGANLISGRIHWARLRAQRSGLSRSIH